MQACQHCLRRSAWKRPSTHPPPGGHPPECPSPSSGHQTAACDVPICTHQVRIRPSLHETEMQQYPHCTIICSPALHPAHNPQAILQNSITLVWALQQLVMNPPVLIRHQAQDKWHLVNVMALRRPPPSLCWSTSRMTNELSEMASDQSQSQRSCDLDVCANDSHTVQQGLQTADFRQTTTSA